MVESCNFKTITPGVTVGKRQSLNTGLNIVLINDNGIGQVEMSLAQMKLIKGYTGESNICTASISLDGFNFYYNKDPCLLIQSSS